MSRDEGASWKDFQEISSQDFKGQRVEFNIVDTNS